MAMLVELHNQGGDGFVYSCNICKRRVETRYHCNECEDYDLCVPCYNEKGHEHSMEKLGLGLDDLDQQQVQRYIQSLVHATHCGELNCQHLSCAKMKRVVEHTKKCKQKTGGGCHICQELIYLLCYHAKHCLERECVVPYCRRIKLKLHCMATMQLQGMQAPPQIPNQATQPSMAG